MEDNRERLRVHSRYIRDNLLPLIMHEGKSQLNKTDLALLNNTLDDVDNMSITIDTLRFSRIEKALMSVASDLHWPPEISSKAAGILFKWEVRLGPLNDLQGDLWGSGGRMEGIRKLNKWWDGRDECDEVRNNE